MPYFPVSSGKGGRENTKVFLFVRAGVKGIPVALATGCLLFRHYGSKRVSRALLGWMETALPSTSTQLIMIGVQSAAIRGRGHGDSDAMDRPVVSCTH